MTPDTGADLRELFDTASAMTEREQEQLLDKLAVEDDQKASELRSLLAASRPARDFFGRLRSSVLPEGVAPAPSASAEDSLPGTRVGQYEILERIGGGGMGVVYKARHLRMGRFAALKFLPGHLVRDEAAKNRFVQEAKAAYALEHPNLCTVFDIGETADGTLYIAMAYYEGETLKERMGRGPLRTDEALAIAVQMADGLAGAHREGIVHRDIKPANVILTTEGTVKLVDFGVALITEDTVDLTSAQTRVGTVAYMSPEQAQGQTVDPRTDVWALGVVLYEMLAGVRPFQGAFLQAMMYELVNSEPTPLGSVRHDLSDEILEIVGRCLAKDPAARYQTAAALLVALHHVAKSEGNTSATVSPAQPENVRSSTESFRVYLSFRRDREEDAALADRIRDHLADPHRVFLDRQGRVGPRWAETIEAELREADYVVVLLSPRALHAEMVLAEVETAFRLAGSNSGRPKILPVRMVESGPLPAPIDAYLAGLPAAFWRNESDTDRLLGELRSVLDGGTRVFDEPPTSVEGGSAGSGFAEPAIAASPVRMETPEGTMDPESSFYIQRAADSVALSAIGRQGETITIKGPRQMGKSSLLIRVVSKAVEEGKRVAYIDFQRMGSAALASADSFYPAFCETIAFELDLDVSLEEVWKRPLSAEQRCTMFVERKVLKSLDAPMVLAMDEVDRMFDTPFRSDFFGMLRSWHNDRAIKPLFRKLDMALVTSTEPYELIADLNQSPFNVGEVVELTDFTRGQVADLNGRYGGPLSAPQMNRLYELLGGHPYLVRRALYLVTTGRYEADRLLAEATDDDGPFGDHLRHHLFRLATGTDLKDAMRQILKDGSCGSERLYWRLRGAGLVVRRAGRIAPRSRLYAEFISRHLS